MKKLLLVLALVSSVPASATSLMIPRSMTLDFKSFGAGIANSYLTAARKEIAKELSKGNVAHYLQTGYGMEGETLVCVEANWETLLKLNKAFEKIPATANAPAPSLDYHAGNCVDAVKAHENTPVAR